MTKLETVVVAGVGASVALNDVIHATIVADAALPEWVTIVGVLGMPALGLLGIVITFLHVGKSKQEVTDKVSSLEIKFDGKMDALIELTRVNAFASGEKAGRSEAATTTQAASDRALLDEGLRAQGAAALLAAQQTPPAADSSHPDSAKQ